MAEQPPHPPDITPREWLERAAVPDRPALSRDELIGALKADEPVSLRELQDAMDDGRLTQEEARELVPGWKNLEALTKSIAGVGSLRGFETGLKAFLPIQQDWTRKMSGLSAALRTPTPIGPLRNPQLTAISELRTEMAGVADILQTTGEQIATTVTLATATVAALERVHGETAALRADLQAGQKSTDRSAKTITRLTWALVGFGLVTVLLTGALAWLTYVLIQKATA